MNNNKYFILGVLRMTEKLKNYEDNPYYWQYKDKPVLLLGGSVEDNLFQVKDLGKQLDLLADAGGNYVRNTMSSRDEGNVWPFKKTNDKFDLDQWNTEYWQRFEKFLKETSKRDIIVQIEIWATFDYYRENWNQDNPFNPANNITYSFEETNLPKEVNSHPTETENNFFWSVPAENNEKVVLKYQQRYVDKILSYTFNYDNILYCMDNETSVTPEWGRYWAQYIKKKAREAGEEVYTTEMWDAWELSHPQHDNTFNHPDIYDFVDVSQNNHNCGQKHYKNAIKQRERIKDNPRPMNNVKIYGGFGDYGSVKNGVQRFWRNIFAGMASARFHRPESGIGINQKAQQMIISARKLLSKFNIFKSEPVNNLLKNKGKAYILQDAGNTLVLYFPEKDSVILNESYKKKNIKISWLNIETGEWEKDEKVNSNGDITIKTPEKGQWVAVIKEEI